MSCNFCKKIWNSKEEYRNQFSQPSEEHPVILRDEDYDNSIVLYVPHNDGRYSTLDIFCCPICGRKLNNGYNGRIDLIKVHNFKLMDAGTTVNGLTITEAMLDEAVKSNLFDNKRIVLNKNEQFKDYRNKEVVERYKHKNIVGSILSGTAVKHINDDGYSYVDATVLISDEFKDKKGYDNWVIDYDEEKSPYFLDYNFCEIF